MTSILSNATIAALGRVVTIIVGIVTTATITRYLGVNGYGLYTLLLSFGIMLQMAADFGLYLTLTRDISRDKVDEQVVFGNISSLRATFLLAWFSLGVLVLFVLPQYREGVLPFVFLAVGLSAQSFSQLLMGVYQKYREVWKATLGDVLGRVIQLGVVLAVVAGMSVEVPGRVVYITIAFLVGTVTAYTLHALLVPGVYPLHWHKSEGQWRRLVASSWPLGALLMLNVVYFRTDALMISWFYSEIEVGWYGLAYRIIESGLFFPAMFGGLLLPHFASAHSKQDNEKVSALLRQGIRLLVVMGVLAGGSLGLFAPNIVLFLSGSEFAQSAVFLRVLSGALMIMFVGNLLGFLLVALHQQKQLLKLYAWLVIGNAVANLLLIPLYGAAAAAWTTLATEAVAMGVAGYMVMRQVKFELPIYALGASVAALFLSGYITKIFPESMHILAQLALMVVLYIATAIVLGALNREDLSLLLKKAPSL